jgi:hypothetical protein
MPEREPRASSVLSQVLERASEVSLPLEIFDSWTEGEVTVCVVYHPTRQTGCSAYADRSRRTSLSMPSQRTSFGMTSSNLSVRRPTV